MATGRLGRLSLSPEGVKERDRLIIDGALTRKCPLAITLGGGYSDPVRLTAEAHAGTFRDAASMLNGSI